MRFSTATLFALLSLAASSLAVPLSSASAHARTPLAVNLKLGLDAPAKVIARAPADFLSASLAARAGASSASSALDKRATKKKATKTVSKKKTKPSSTTRRYSASVLALAAKLSENATAQPLAKAAAKKVKHAARALLTPLSLANQSQQGLKRKRAEFVPSHKIRAEMIIEDAMRF